MKGFLLGAVLLLVVQHLISTGQSQGTGPKALVANARQLTDDDLQQLARYATEHPSPEIYLRIYRAYERRGDYRKALIYLRRADKLSQFEIGD